MCGKGLRLTLVCFLVAALTELPKRSDGAVQQISVGPYGNCLALLDEGSVREWPISDVPSDLARIVKQVAAGRAHNLALLENGTVRAWGDNNNGQANVPIGLVKVKQVAAGDVHSLALLEDGTLISWGQGVAAIVPPGIKNVKQIAAGVVHNVAVLENGTVRAWGSEVNWGHALPISVPNDLANVTQVAAGFYHNLALLSDGTVRAWGENSNGQASVPSDLKDVQQIAAGYYHSLAVLKNGTIRGWGEDQYNVSTGGRGLRDVIQVAGGAYHSVALHKDGTVSAWGYGSSTDVPPDLQIPRGQQAPAPLPISTVWITPPVTATTEVASPPPIGAIVGGVLGGIAAVAIIVVLFLSHARRKRKSKQQEPDQVVWDVSPGYPLASKEEEQTMMTEASPAAAHYESTVLTVDHPLNYSKSSTEATSNWMSVAYPAPGVRTFPDGAAEPSPETISNTPTTLAPITFTTSQTVNVPSIPTTNATVGQPPALIITDASSTVEPPADATSVPNLPGPQSDAHPISVVARPHPTSRLVVDATDIEINYSIPPLGEGGFGIVHVGLFKKATPVAVKKIRGQLDEKTIRMFENEINAWEGLVQKNVLPLMAYCISPPMLVSDLMKQGNLRQYLTRCNWDPSIALKLLCDIASGMAYLHSQGIIHGDLKPVNVMVDENRAMIADFGLSKVRQEVSASSSSRGSAAAAGGTPAFVAPEVYKGQPLRPPADVYAFGILCYEVLSKGQRAYAEVPNVAVIGYRVAVEGLRPLRPQEVSDELWELMRRCWAQDAGDRPQFVEIRDALSAMLGSV